MIFTKMRQYTKHGVIIIAVLFVLSLTYMAFQEGLPAFRSTPEGQMDMGNYEEPVAIVEGNTITRLEFLSTVSDVMQEQSRQGPIQPEMEEQIRAMALDRIIDYRLLLKAVEDENIPVSDEDVDEALEEFMGYFESEEEFNDWLEHNQYGIDINQLREYLKEDVKVEKLIDAKSGEVTITDQQVIDYYEGVRVSEIFIRAEDGEDPEALERAESVLSQLQQGADFVSMVEQYSDDETSLWWGGDAGFWRKKDYADDELFQEAISLNVGDITGVLSSEQGYHILKVTDKSLGTDPEFEEQKEDIRNDLISRVQQENFEDWYQSYRQAANVEIYDYQMKAYNLMQEGKYEEAILEYEKAIDKEPRRAYLHVSIAQAYDAVEDEESALEAYESAVSIISDDPNLRFILGQAYLNQGMDEKAIEEFGHVFDLAYEVSFENLMVLFQLSSIYSDMGLEEKSEEALNKYYDMYDEMMEEYYGAMEGDIELDMDDIEGYMDDDMEDN